MRFTRDPRSRLMVPDRRLRMAAPQQALLMGGGAPSDPYFSYLVLGLDASNLANNSTSFTDYSTAANTLTANGNAKASTTSPKFNTSSVLCDGNSDNISLPFFSGLDVGSGDWTLRMWLKLAATGSLRFIFGNRTATGNNGFFCYVNSSASLVLNANEGTLISNATGGTFTAGVWQFLSISRFGTNVYAHLDGNAVLNLSSVSGAVGTSNASKIYIGSAHGEAGSRDWDGNFDQVQFYKGIAIYQSASAYTPPTAPSPHQ